MMKTPKIAGILLAPKFQRLCYSSAIALFLLIVVVGSLPGARHDIGQFASGAVLHSTAYAVLGILIFLGSGGNASRRAIKATLTVALMGAVDEYVQSFFPYRNAAVSDWLVDVAAGGSVSVLLWNAWPRLGEQLVAD
jgi:VanZ family protein